jgi:uncharacterized membrane protein YkvA (DUF1232 family)
MALTITLEISDDELDYFRSVMRRVRVAGHSRPAAAIVAAAAREVSRLRSTVRSPFIARRLARVERLIAMLDDPQWQLPEPERRRVLDGLAYVAEAHDLVPDNVPVLGLLDDAIMLEVVLRDLRHELDGYEEFEAYRRDRTGHVGRRPAEAGVSRQDWLDSRREALHTRIRERRERDLVLHGEPLGLITHF